MRKILLALAVLAVVIATESCRRKGDETLKNGGLSAEMIKDSTRVEFAETEFAYDTITEGDKVEHTFKFTNVGEKNLVIANAYGSCGCTVPEYPKEPIAPGKTGEVKVTFNSAGKKGPQKKSITMIMNTNLRNEVVFLSGFVKEKAEDAAQ